MTNPVFIPKAQWLKTHTDGAGRNLGLDIVRAVCLLVIVLSHTNNYLGTFTGIYKIIFPLSYLSQELFFGLSGFLVGKQIIKHLNTPGTPLNLTNFLKNRWTRTVPFYFIFLVINLILFYTIYQNTWRRFENTFNPFSYFFFLQNLNWRHPAFFPEISPLPVEEWSFLLLPIPILILVKCIKKPLSSTQLVSLLAAEAIIVIIFRAYYVITQNPELDWELRKIVVYRLDALIYGFMLRVLMNKYEGFFFSNRFGLLVIGLLVSIAFYFSKFLINPLLYKTLIFFVLPLFMTFLLPYFFLSGFRKLNIALKAFFTHMSLISYSVLLTHLYFLQFFLLWIYTPKSFFEGLVFSVIYLGILFPIATLFFNYVERPVLMRRKK